MASLTRLDLNVSSAAWNAVGFPIGAWKLGNTCVSVGEHEAKQGISASILGLEGDIGVLNLTPSTDVPFCEVASEALGLESVDHLMVRTRDAEKTLSSLSKSLGVDISVDVNGEQSVWLDSVRIDMVPTPDLSEPAELWGVAFRVTNLDVVAERLGGEVLGAPKAARQSGQRVAVFRSGAGLGVPTALVDLLG